jgi:hypothetical protein
LCAPIFARQKSGAVPLLVLTRRRPLRTFGRSGRLKARAPVHKINRLEAVTRCAAPAAVRVRVRRPHPACSPLTELRMTLATLLS